MGPGSRASALGRDDSGGFARRFSLLTVTIATLALAGLVLVGQGLWIHAKALLAQVLLERAFAQTLQTGHDVKPWSWADTWPVARVELPRLGRSAWRDAPPPQ